MRTNVFSIAAITLAVGFFSCTQDSDLEETAQPLTQTAMVSRAVGETHFFYTDKGDKIFLRVRRDKIIVKTAENADKGALLKREVLSLDQQPVNAKGIWTKASIDATANGLDDVLNLPGVEDASYGLESKSGMMHYLTDKIFIGSANPKDALAKVGVADAIVEIKLFNKYHDTYLVTLDVKQEDILSVCGRLYESGLCRFAEPNFIVEAKLHNEFYPQQWGLKNTWITGQNTSTVDIKAEPAWVITRGNPDIKIAVLDVGVDLTHDDLQANMLPGYDVSSITSPGARDGSPWGNNYHGTAVAGIIAAVNNSIGIVGVAPNCKIVPIRIGYHYDGSTDLQGFSYESAAEAIRYAWETAGADVINCSWTCDNYSTAIADELVDATTQGRENKGCVVVFCAGNHGDTTLPYPASSANVISVGAIEQIGIKWGLSNSGEALDVIAPGYDIYTTDISSSVGYNKQNSSAGDYIDGAVGTSMAAPYVAGVAALILSKNPELDQQQVRNIIESTAQKEAVSPYQFNQNKPNGMWCISAGYGLVNAYAALQNTPYPVSYSQVNISFVNNTSSQITVQMMVDDQMTPYALPLPNVYTIAAWQTSSTTLTLTEDAHSFALNDLAPNLSRTFNLDIDGSGDITFTRSSSYWSCTSDYQQLAQVRTTPAEE